MTETKKDYYKDCEYYPMGVDTVGTVAFRYATKGYAGHYCLPDGAMMADKVDLSKAFKDAFY